MVSHSEGMGFEHKAKSTKTGKLGMPSSSLDTAKKYSMLLCKIYKKKNCDNVKIGNTSSMNVN